jgi:hypothetical protein
MADEQNLAPVGADKETGAVVADLSQQYDEPIARPAHWVASLLWIILVSTCAVIALLAAAALILDYLSGSPSQSGAKETILLIFSTAFNALVALFVTRPGTR